MDPKQAAQILAKIDSVVLPLNVLALVHYTKLLRACGVKHITVKSVILLP